MANAPCACAPASEDASSDLASTNGAEAAVAATEKAAVLEPAAGGGLPSPPTSSSAPAPAIAPPSPEKGSWSLGDLKGWSLGMLDRIVGPSRS